jgi:hypothetical protein
MIAVAAAAGLLRSLLTIATSHVKLAIQTSTQRYEIMTYAFFLFLFIKHRESSRPQTLPTMQGNARAMQCNFLS